MTLFIPVIALLQFTTRLPLGKEQDFSAFARASWLYPVAGYVTGGITAGVLLLLPFSPDTSAAAALVLLLLLSGANHFDGLLDLGDGLMAHGDQKKRVAALTDRAVGAGGVTAGISVILLSYASLASTNSPFLLAGFVLCGEVLSRYAMAVMTVTARPFHDGIHAFLHSHAKKWFIPASTLLLVPLFCLPIISLIFPLLLLTTLVVTGGMQRMAYRVFWGANGDIIGATGEIVRCMVFLVSALAGIVF
ncbi:MAG: adenosylcobinamide-GDP ribazoletransferase [Methanospirillaceae archaeon]|nr:adenosylcobinamide-GDP ribazoletransferase [Methanospirillaceae archaeon]